MSTGKGNGRGKLPDLRIEAVVQKPDANGEMKTHWVPIGAAWRTEQGDYTGEIRAEPIEWQHSSERRIFLRAPDDSPPRR